MEGTLEGRMGLAVNSEKTKVVDLDAERPSLVFLGYEFRKVRVRLFGTGRRYLHFGPSPKSVKRVCRMKSHNNALNRREQVHGNGKSTRWKVVCGKSARTV